MAFERKTAVVENLWWHVCQGGGGLVEGKDGTLVEGKKSEDREVGGEERR